MLIVTAALAAVSDYFGYALPSLRWLYSFSATPDQILDAEVRDSWFGSIDWPWLREHQGEIIGNVACGLLFLLGLVLIGRGGGFQWNPLTVRKMARFKSIGRGYGSLKLLGLLFFISLLDQTLVGKRALVVRYEGEWSFPAFDKRVHLDNEYGGESAEEANFRELKKRFKTESPESLVIMPLVPWDQSFDSDEKVTKELVLINGVIHEPSGKDPFNGFAVAFQEGNRELKVRSGRIRGGKLTGPAQVYDEVGEMAGREEWSDGERLSTSVEDEVEMKEGRWAEVIYAPLPPDIETGHFLGTDSKGWDILAQLYGGMQVLFKASVLYIFMTYLIGVAMGAMMGYFGGVFDLVMQRVMEIMSNVPSLLVIMIIIANLGRDRVTLGTILLVFCIFSWIGVATYLRTATFKEKARDYVNAARVVGAPTRRVIFRHILPNVIATIVTLIPFSVSSVITSLTALDFLGFGLPDRYPSWGRLLNDGVSNLSSPWIVSSVFAMLVLVLLLVTFVGEAIREAFDPRTFTTYQ
ncbi:ABC transporter permease subunit [Haloferula sp.]|uniref:ABC transporter permease subunit n=1 Tax=Haloferula sp. TaxID=2497595 RepID=UPI003C745FEA